jgi:hypothetical protein
MAAIGLSATENLAGVDDSYIIFVANNFAFVGPDEVLGTGPGEIDPQNPPLARLPFGIDAVNGVVYINGQVRINAGGSTLDSLAAVTGIYVSYTSSFWKVDSTGAAVNTSIVLTANFTDGLSGTVTWTKSGAGTAPPGAGTSNTWTIYAADQTDDSCTYTASYTTGGTTYSDSVTVVRLRDGSNALTALLSNESHTVPANVTGAVTDYTGAAGTMRVFKGSTELFTPDVAFSITSNPDTLTASINSTTGAYAVTASGLWADGNRTTSLTLRATVGGVTLDKQFTLTKANTGATGTGTPGDDGANGTRTAVLDMYQWAASTPTTFPSGTSTFTWATGQFTAPLTTNGWSLAPPAPVAGQTLYVARQVYVDTGTGATSSVSWTTTTALTIAAAGSHGTRTGVLELYKWAAAQPTTNFPAGSSTYTWATGQFTAPATLNGWSLTPSAPVQGQTLWAARQVAVDSTTAATTNVTWAATTSYPIAYAATNGTNGTPGARGSLTGYGSMFGLTTSSWPDADPYVNGTADKQANAVIYNMLNGTSLTTQASSAHLRIGDTVTLSNGSSFAKTKYWSGSGWVIPGVTIDGNLLVNGTVSANVLNGGSITSSTVNLGSGSFQVDVSGNVTSTKFQGFNAQFSNTFDPTKPAARCLSYTGNSTAETFLSSTSTTNAGAAAHAIRGVNNHSGSSGLVGLASAFDFYAEGSGTNYGPFTGAHDGLVSKRKDLDLVAGDIVVDVRCVARRNVSNTLFIVTASSQPNERGVIGVLATEREKLTASNPPTALVLGFHEEREEIQLPDGSTKVESRHVYEVDPKLPLLARSNERIAFNALGEGQMNVCGEGGNIRRGDLIVASSMRGKGMRQADDIVRGYTVAKAREDVTFTHADEVKTVACIYLCG